MKTLLLDQETWDLCVDRSGNIAVAAEPYSQAQDAASSMRTFAGEIWYDQARGIPYFDKVLGQAPSLPLLRAYLEEAALFVPGVVEARAYFSALEDRRLTGQVQIRNTAGQVSVTGLLGGAYGGTTATGAGS
ncbi:hypothetical protein MKK88_14915 [Methylobacterium sp. E-005]|uniref:hypothetical protein n=1 Tax=Methylobacterium sp. E-005 TaxID=2836549 RepID=UPI001FB8AB1F|nr:hypothetical protein [Methylobacterium sp. E-005]MCJ2087266.1 hypothetical protein [Methylobacterium sp. E-005]